ncbi:L-alanine-DL-glutamate epimerase [Halorubrum aquaticum]|uniref:glucarate dehydratase n=1 Tax=Halorubrum aquaticum TaxID=387340 RepID=A0A1I3BCP0_9EURY|nr:mandelate racemase/muconate lactonizing enzyme family protein [Halorubrum aquaticum]SFH60054.1 L-alanine-DL-glutamate epimerase [Halorubrum aquaticum]
MRIASLEAVPVSIDVKPLGDGLGVAPYVAGYTVVESAERLVIRLETEDGTVGWGETVTNPSPSVAVDLVEDVIAEEVVGRSVWEIERVVDAFEYPYMRITPLVSGVEMAMLDALGKCFDAPLHQLLGGKVTDSVPVAFCLGILDPEESAEQAAAALDRGFDVLKTKGGLDADEDVARMRAMHEATDGRLDLRLDANQTWGFEEAVRVGARLEDAGVYPQYLEQPIRIDTAGSYARLRNRLRTPIAVNEDAYFPYNLYELLKRDAIDVAVLDLIPAGGVMATKQLAGLAAESGVSLSHHSSFEFGIKTAAVLHLVASTPEFTLAPDRVNYALEDDVIADRFEVVDGEMTVPTEPGLGVDVDEEKVAEHRIPI